MTRRYHQPRGRSSRSCSYSRSPPPRRMAPNMRSMPDSSDAGKPRHRDYPPHHQIYIAKFAPRTREIDLQRAFEKFGKIASIDLKDRGCYAFIVYGDGRSAKDAIENMDGRPLPYTQERLVVEQAGIHSRNRGPRRRRSSSGSNPRGDRSKTGGPGFNPNDLCYNCNRPGHWAAECKEELTKRRRDVTEGRCFICGEKGHKRSDCPRS